MPSRQMKMNRRPAQVPREGDTLGSAALGLAVVILGYAMSFGYDGGGMARTQMPIWFLRVTTQRLFATNVIIIIFWLSLLGLSYVVSSLVRMFGRKSWIARHVFPLLLFAILIADTRFQWRQFPIASACSADWMWLHRMAIGANLVAVVIVVWSALFTTCWRKGWFRERALSSVRGWGVLAVFAFFLMLSSVELGRLWSVVSGTSAMVIHGNPDRLVMFLADDDVVLGAIQRKTGTIERRYWLVQRSALGATPFVQENFPTLLRAGAISSSTTPPERQSFPQPLP